MERLKDILYDLSDIFITVLIIAVIFFVITWKLNDAMPANQTLLTLSESINESTSDSSLRQTTEPLLSTDAGTPRDIVATKKEIETIETIASSEKDISEDELSEATTDTISTDSIQDITISIENENNDPAYFVVPFGATATEIANDLVELKLIDNQSEFLNQLANRGDEINLKAGTFDLSDNLSTDGIIDVLIGD